VPDSVSRVAFSHSAPEHIWRDIHELFVESFSNAPYFEDVTELSTILQWGPEHLGQGHGRLVVAKRGEQIVGFALGNALSGDSAWQSILSRFSESSGEAAWALANQEDALIVHELAVRRSERGNGIASICMTALLEGRPESQTFIGVYDRAIDAASMYRHWQLATIGQVPIHNGSVNLNVLNGRTAELATRTKLRTP
jgi:GNAT superfamily N-acetyltransferase